MEFVLEILMDLLFDGVAAELVGEKTARKAWKNHPFRFIAVILALVALIVLAFIGAVWLINFIGILPYRSLGEILFLGRGGNILAEVMIVMTIIFAVIFGIAILSGVTALTAKYFMRNIMPKREKLSKKEKRISAIVIAALVAVFAFVSYCYAFNATVFTETEIIKYSFVNPKGTEYRYSDIDTVEVNSNGSDINLLMKSGKKKIRFSYESDSYSDLDKYKNNDYLFIADVLDRFRNEGAEIVYNCSCDDIKQYVDEEYYKENLKRIFG